MKNAVVIDPTKRTTAMYSVTGKKLGVTIMQLELESGGRAIADIAFGSSIVIALSFLK